MSYINKEWVKYEFRTIDELLEFLNEAKDDFIFPPTIIYRDECFLVLVYRTMLYY